MRAARSWLVGFLIMLVGGAVLACLFGSMIFALTALVGAS